MDLPDCPPGAEGYEDSVVEVPKKNKEECTKAEQEFKEHLSSLRIKLEDGSFRTMVERRGRDVSGAWIYLCFPCGATCSGESTLQNHLVGKKHKVKLSLKTSWPVSIFETHPYVLNEKGPKSTEASERESVLNKIVETVNVYQKSNSELEEKYSKFRNVDCQLQATLDKIRAPLLGLEYLVEHPPIESHHEPSYLCTLCSKQGHPRTIINHVTCYWHKQTYIARHFPKASLRLAPYRTTTSNKYREGVTVVLNRLAHKIEKTFGRRKPILIDKHVFETERDCIYQWLLKGPHCAEEPGLTLEEVVDANLIESLAEKDESQENIERPGNFNNKKELSPPKVSAPAKPQFGSNIHKGNLRQRHRSKSLESLSDISDDLNPVKPHVSKYHIDRRVNRGSEQVSQFSNKYNPKPYERPGAQNVKARPANYHYKLKLVEDQRKHAEESAIKTQKYHEKNPEKHPLYPEEWKKYWNKRYKELQAEGKDPLKYDFKPEWSVYWMKKMKELHEEELRINIMEIYRKMCVTPPDLKRPSPEPRRSPGRRFIDNRRSPSSRRKSPGFRRSPEPRRRSPEPRRRSPDPRRRSPDIRRRSPEKMVLELHKRSPGPLRRSPDHMRKRSPIGRLKSPEANRLSSIGRYNSPVHRKRSPERWSPDKRRYSPVERLRSPSSSHRSLKYGRDHRSPEYRPTPPKRMSLARSRSPHMRLSRERARSPLSRREVEGRNRSPRAAPSLQTVLISDDELKPEGSLSPWNSGDSLGSLPEVGVRDSSSGPENVVATLRLLVALEDYLGSIGPKIVDLLTEALRMEKERALSSEELLVRESAVVLIETAKEKLKGAAQAGLVSAAAVGAVRAAVVRAAATLHEADKRMNKLKESRVASGGAGAGAARGEAGVRVAGVGQVERAQIAQQMAAALIAEGKTDISAEELEHLVDAVVGMAEAKKREVRQDRAPLSAPSALQLLQSAYDENDKRADKSQAAADAMDGLSDSDLETLLKNFNELSAEEQHSLIAYLKKLEAREPQRVERLRRYVSTEPTKAKKEAPVPAAPAAVPKTVTIESDDDDYTVEEVVKTVTQKVKEDKIRQEMEIVKKSIEESKPMKPSEEMKADKMLPNLELLNNSSAADLLALVQASMQFTSANNPTPMYRGFN